MDLFNKKKLARAQQELTNATQTLLERDLSGFGAGISHGGERDLYTIYGYPQRPQFNYLYQYATKNALAGTVVFKVPKSCWRDGFELYTEPEAEGTQLLEKELKTLKKKGMLSVFERADALNRIGRFSAVFVGVPDGLEPNEPLGRVMGNSAIKSVYFRPFAYDGIQPYKYDTDPMSERFGLPETYQLQIIGRGDTDKEQTPQPIIAHWTRVIHIAETKLDSEIEGIPILRQVINNVLDIEKSAGGSSEAYFRNARGKTAFEVDKEFAGSLINNQEAQAALEAAAKKFTNNQQDQVLAVGSTVKSLSTPHASPKDTVMVSYFAVSGKTGIPVRFLTGEGAGQLAGSEDKLAYNVMVDDRKELFCEVQFVDRVLQILNDSGVLTVPEEYCVYWPKQQATTEAEQAEIGLKKAQALSAVVTASSTVGGDSINLESALNEVYLTDIEVEEFDFDAPIDDEQVNNPPPMAPGGDSETSDQDN